MAKHPLLPESLRRAVRARPRLQRVVWAAEAGLIACVWMVCAALPTNVASRLGRRLLRFAGPRLGKNELVEHNLRIAFPEQSPEQRGNLAREIWGNLGAILAELPHLRALAATIDVRVDYEGDVHAVIEPGRPVVLVTAHVGIWDLAPLAAKPHSVPLTVIFTPESNPFLDRFIQRFREPLGCTLLDRNRSLRALMRELAEGRTIGIVADHRVDDGESIPFFGVPTPTTLVPAKLALRYGCDLVPLRVERLQDARFRVSITDPIRPADPNASPREQARQMTRDMNARFEQWIRARPEQWVCTARRWPKPPKKRKRLAAPVALEPARNAE
jgi:KDO2-lipid IV(A) lauroyltransferase